MEVFDDIYCVRKILEGRTELFSVLLQRYNRQVFTLVSGIVRNREDAEEITQDVFVKVFRYIGTFKGDAGFSTWLYRIAYNTAISHTRHKRMEFLPMENFLIENTSEEKITHIQEENASDMQLELLDKALEALPAEERALITLFHLKGKSIDEVSGITGLSNTNVKTKLHRIRKKIYIFMESKQKGELQ